MTLSVGVSPSATAVSLTDGHLRNFYRVVASDASAEQMKQNPLPKTPEDQRPRP